MVVTRRMFVAGCLLALGAGPARASGRTIRRGGSLWASVDSGGSIRVDGRLAGSFSSSSGDVRRDGSLVGRVEPDGTLRSDGSLVGRVERDGALRLDGSLVGSVASDGTIRHHGSIWGSAGPCPTFDDLREVAAVLYFFSGDF